MTTDTRFYFELHLPDSPDEFQSFHEKIFQIIHDHSESYEDYLTGAHYRSWVGLSYPKFGELQHYVEQDCLLDDAFVLNFAIKHPGLFVGDTVHCVSVKQGSLEVLWGSDALRSFCDDGVKVSDIHSVPEGCSESIFKRDRRPERRYGKKLLKKTKLFNVDSRERVFIPDSITEPLPRFASISSSRKRKPIHIRRVATDTINSGWYSMYGLSTRGSTVPLLVV